jgi:hypothetical protein
MADPRPLFYVTAIVVLGLVVWVASVLLRPGPAWKLAAGPGGPDGPSDANAPKDAGANTQVGPEAAEEASADDPPAADHSSPKNS